MKKKLLSLFLALSMLLTSVLCLLPVAAEDNPDAEALKYNSKFVCRVGTADEAKANDYAGYYTSTKAAMDAAFKDKKDTTVTITLIADDSTVGETLVVTSGNTLILNGRKSDTENFTYTSKGGFRANGGNVTVKNLNVVVTAGTAKQAIGGIHTAHTMTFENCDIRGGSAYDRTDNGLFYVVNGVKATLNLINCTVGIDKKDLWNGDKMTDRHLFVNFAKGEATLNLNHVTIDVSDVTNANGISWTGGTVNISDSTISVNRNGIDDAAKNITVVKSTLTAKNQVFAMSRTPSTVTVNISLEGSTVKSTGTGGDNNALYIYQNKGAVTVNAVNTTLESKGHAVQFKETMADVLLSLDGTSKVNGEHRAIQISGIQSSVVVTAAGQTEIQTTDADWTCAIFISGHGNANSFNLTLQDNAKLVSNKSAIKFRNTDSYKMTKARLNSDK